MYAVNVSRYLHVRQYIILWGAVIQLVRQIIIIIKNYIQLKLANVLIFRYTLYKEG
jgi:hypothetical protein